MGFLSEIKKLLFAKSSIAKSAGEKVVEAGKDLGGKVMDKGGDALSSTKDIASEAISKAKEVAENVGGEMMDKAGPMVEKGKSLVEEVGGKVLDVGENLAEKAGDIAEDIGGKVIEKASPILDKAKDVAGDAGEHVAETFKKAGKDVADKAKEFYDKAQEAAAAEGRPTGDVKSSVESIKDKATDFFNKAQEEAAADDLAKAAKDKLSETSMDDVVNKAKDLGDDIQAKVDQKEFVPNYKQKDSSLLDGQEDFFTKAERFADGDYDMDGKKNSAPKIEDDPSYTADKSEGSTKGFEDADGDGNDLVDDAIVIKDKDGNEIPRLELPDEEGE